MAISFHQVAHEILTLPNILIGWLKVIAFFPLDFYFATLRLTDLPFYLALFSATSRSSLMQQRCLPEFHPLSILTKKSFQMQTSPKTYPNTLLLLKIHSLLTSNY